MNLAGLRRRASGWLPALVVFVVVIVLWEVTLTVFSVQSFLFPKPSVIFAAFLDDQATLLKGLVFTGTEAIGGLLIGVFLGTAAGLATARWATAREILVPVAIAASSIPILAFAPITINWFGSESVLPRMTISALMVFFPVMVNTVRGLTQVEPAALELMRSYAAGDMEILRRLRIPNALPYWFTALRIATTLAVIGSVVGEFFGGPLYALGPIHHVLHGPVQVPDRMGGHRARLRAGDRLLPGGGGRGAIRAALAAGPPGRGGVGGSGWAWPGVVPARVGRADRTDGLVNAALTCRGSRERVRGGTRCPFASDSGSSAWPYGSSPPAVRAARPP